MAWFNESAANSTLTDEDFDTVLRIMVSQLLTSIALLLWLTQRRGWPMARGLILGLFYVLLSLYRGLYKVRDASGWILPIHLASLNTKNPHFIALTMAYSILGIVGSIITLSAPFENYTLAVILTDCLITFFVLLVMWNLILTQLTGPSRKSMKDFISPNIPQQCRKVIRHKRINNT